jgi:hypothetical protein
VNVINCDSEKPETELSEASGERNGTKNCAGVSEERERMITKTDN